MVTTSVEQLLYFFITLTIEHSIGAQKIESKRELKSLKDNMSKQNCEEGTKDMPYVPDLSTNYNSDDSRSTTSLKRSLSAIIQNQFKTPSPKYLEIKFSTGNHQRQQAKQQKQVDFKPQTSFVFQTPKKYNSDDECYTPKLSHKGLTRKDFIKACSLDCIENKPAKVRKCNSKNSPNFNIVARKKSQLISNKEIIHKLEHPIVNSHRGSSKPKYRRFSPSSVQSIIRPDSITLDELSLPNLQNSNLPNKFSESDFFTPPHLLGSHSYAEQCNTSSDIATPHYSRSMITESLRKNIHTLLLPTLSEAD